MTGNAASRGKLAQGDLREDDPRYEPGNFATNLPILTAVRTVAKRHRVSPAQVALAWLLGQGDDIIAIPGTKRRSTMEDSMAAVGLVLSPEDRDALEAASPPGGTAGERYSPQGMKLVRV